MYKERNGPLFPWFSWNGTEFMERNGFCSWNGTKFLERNGFVLGTERNGPFFAGPGWQQRLPLAYIVDVYICIYIYIYMGPSPLGPLIRKYI